MKSQHLPTNGIIQALVFVVLSTFLGTKLSPTSWHFCVDEVPFPRDSFIRSPEALDFYEIKKAEAN